jgi:preprotein translocase subunit SecY
MDRVMNFLRHVWSAEDLRNRILITISLLVVYRLAAHIPLPGINVEVVQNLLNSGQGAVGGNLVGLLDLLSGGTVSNLSVLAMGVYP